MDLTNYQIKKSKITNERQLILQQFLDRLNAERKPPYPPISSVRLGMKLAHVSTHDLKIFYADANYAKNFSSYFWWKLDINKQK